MAARWSSENVVVEFRDSQVSYGANGAFRACALPGSPPPRGRVCLGVVGATPSPAEEVGKRVARSCQTRAGEGSLDDRWVGWGCHWRGFGVPFLDTGSGVCLGTPKCRDCGFVSAERRLPRTRVVSEGVFAAPAPGDFGLLTELLGASDAWISLPHGTVKWIRFKKNKQLKLHAECLFQRLSF